MLGLGLGLGLLGLGLLGLGLGLGYLHVWVQRGGAKQGLHRNKPLGLKFFELMISSCLING